MSKHAGPGRDECLSRGLLLCLGLGLGAVFLAVFVVVLAAGSLGAEKNPSKRLRITEAQR